MNLSSIIEIIIPSAITGLGGWVFGRRRNNAEIKKIEIDNAERLVEVWQKSADSMEKQIADLLNITEVLRKENLLLKETVYKLQEEITELKSQNVKLINKLNEIKKYAQRNNTDNNVGSVE